MSTFGVNKLFLLCFFVYTFSYVCAVPVIQTVPSSLYMVHLQPSEAVLIDESIMAASTNQYWVWVPQMRHWHSLRKKTNETHKPAISHMVHRWIMLLVFSFLMLEQCHSENRYCFLCTSWEKVGFLIRTGTMFAFACHYVDRFPSSVLPQELQYLWSIWYRLLIVSTAPMSTSSYMMKTPSSGLPMPALVHRTLHSGEVIFTGGLNKWIMMYENWESKKHKCIFQQKWELIL